MDTVKTERVKPATELPWEIDGAEITDGIHEVARVPAHGPSNFRRQDLEYIVHAANLYPELVAALRDAERWLGVATIGNPATGPREAWERCRSMLAKCGPALDDERDAYPSGTVDDLERYPTAGSPWPGEAAKQ